jgi:ATP-dependent DNA helicase RecQ
MPTGGGKSLCYQLPSLLREGCGIVVSPLIALMRDQVEGLLDAGVKAAVLNSSLSWEEASSVEQRLLAGDLDLLYIAPERLLTPRCLDLLARAQLALFAIDEAHCVSQWGHDFRPEYIELSMLAERFPNVPRIRNTTCSIRPRSMLASMTCRRVRLGPKATKSRACREMPGPGISIDSLSLVQALLIMQR